MEKNNYNWYKMDTLSMFVVWLGNVLGSFMLEVLSELSNIIKNSVLELYCRDFCKPFIFGSVGVSLPSHHRPLQMPVLPNVRHPFVAMFLLE